VYATCLFCHAPLGRNETLESFPVGRRLAFDAERGRLWVVCRACERWNLTPAEERWEAIEAAERLYRDTHRRAATDNVGLARVADGTELVRVGRPLRPEFAAWRYGDQFGRRRRRQLAVSGAGVAAVGALVVGGVSAGVGLLSFGWVIGQALQHVVHGSPGKVVARVRIQDVPLELTRRDLARVRIDGNRAAPFTVDIRREHGRWRAEGAEALRLMSQIIPAANRFGGRPEDVRAAVAAMERDGGAEGYVERLRARAAVTRHGGSDTSSRWWGTDDVPQTGLYALPPVDRLALEMAVHEEQERRALDGELLELERAWRDAEEIAAIADDLLVPDGIRRRFDALTSRRPRG
jgi:hypothetical protein